MPVNQWGELLTFLFVGIALGMDSFSVSIGLGMQRMRLRYVAKISIVNGLFHMLMPLIGILIGNYLSGFMGQFAVTLGGILLIFFGVHMILSSFLGEESSPSWVSTTLAGMILFSIGVSIDAFSVGLSFGLFSANIWLMVILFGLTAVFLTALGLLLGRKVGSWIGKYSEAFGGMVLLSFGMKFIM